MDNDQRTAARRQGERVVINDQGSWWHGREGVVKTVTDQGLVFVTLHGCVLQFEPALLEPAG